MSTALVPAPAIELAARGHWSAAWPHVAPTAAALVTGGSCADLLWLHELCRQLGLDVRRRWIGRALRRRFPDDLRVRATTVLDLMRRGRVADAWYAIRDDAYPDAAVEHRVPWLLAKARVRHDLRDHAAAAELIDAAEAQAPDDPWVATERIWALQAADKTAEALAACAAARQRFPGHANLIAVECWVRHDANVAGLLEHLALARQQLRSPYLDGVYAMMCHENGDSGAACAVWEQLLAEPWHERRLRAAWRFALVHTCRERGDDARALQHAEAAGRFATGAAERLRQHLAQPDPGARRRVVLTVPFVRQDQLTCAPATIASLLAWFGAPIDQREIAARITWDGTASQNELQWARERGLVVRFFQFDPEVAKRLLDLGLPFALSTRFETSAHRQAVVGYDPVLRTFVLRDPSVHELREVDAEWLSAITRRGGDCVLLLPAEVAERMELPPLPAEAETLEWLQLRLDIDARRLAGVPQRVEALLARTTGALRFEIETRMLDERGERNRLVELYRQAHTEAPDDAYWQYRYVAELLNQDRWQEARAVLEALVQRSGSPFLRMMLADQWRHDARLRPEAAAMMRRALRARGRDARTWQRHACLVADDGRQAEAADLHRTAAMLDPTDEWHAVSYFRALRSIGKADQGLLWLQQRVSAAAGRSSAPAGTLADALEEMHRPDDAIAVLQQALASHDTPEQRDRLCHLLLRHRHLDAARKLLAEPDRFRPVDHALRRRDVASASGDRAGARAALQDAVAAMPAHVAAQSALLHLILAEDGLAPALARADELVEQHHDHAALAVEIVEFLRHVEDHARAERVLRRLVGEHPHEHWLRGKLARFLLQRGRVDEAAPLLAELRIATPRSSPVWADIADLARARGDLPEARAAATRAIELAPGNTWCLRLLLNLATSRDDALTALRLPMRLLLERPQAPATGELEPLVPILAPLPKQELDAWFDALAAAFPGVSAVTVARCEAVLHNDPAKAMPLAEALVAAERWRTDHHLRLARCLRASNRRADERRALEALLLVDPACAQAFVEIGESFDQEGRLPQAVATFERGLERAPGYATLHGMLADALWRLGQRERALSCAARACELDPSYSWAFEARVSWLAELGRHDDALALTEKMVRDDPHWSVSHDLRARALAAVGRHEERIASLQQALALSPRLGSTRLMLVDALIGLKRLDEARAVIDAGKALLGDDPPLLLREVALVRTSGRIDEARELLRELLQRHPDFEQGWRRLLSFYDEEGRGDDILALYRDPPPALRNDCVLCGYAAAVLRERGDAAGAEQAFERALAIEQGYAWARDQLCELLLGQQKPERVLELLPDHDTPERLDWQHARLVTEAAAGVGRFDIAQRAFLRLLRDDPPRRRMVLGDLDALLRKRHGKEHERALRSAVAAADGDPAVAFNWLRILASRRHWRRFWRGVDEAHAKFTPKAGVQPLAELLNDVRHVTKVPGLARWVRKNLHPPIRSTQAAGELLYALAFDDDCRREMIRLFGDDWRRPDVQGWMLANLSGALIKAGRLDEATAVCRHALDAVPHDHSYWWHRRDLADVELRRGRFAAARLGCTTPPAEYASVRLDMYQIALAAELRLTPWWRRRRLLLERLPETFRRLDALLAKPSQSQPQLRARWLFRGCPGFMTLLLLCGPRGVQFARTLLRA
ncbi:MAG TPA: tetratricopeptide repeat protein [Planctomycetota bacterium]